MAIFHVVKKKLGHIKSVVTFESIELSATRSVEATISFFIIINEFQFYNRLQAAIHPDSIRAPTKCILHGAVVEQWAQMAKRESMAVWSCSHSSHQM